MPGTLESQVSNFSLNGWRQRGKIALTHFCRNPYDHSMLSSYEHRMPSYSVNSFSAENS